MSNPRKKLIQHWNQCSFVYLFTWHKKIKRKQVEILSFVSWDRELISSQKFHKQTSSDFWHNQVILTSIILKWVRILRNLCLIENCVSLKFEVFINNWFRCNWWFAIRFAWENWHWQATLRSINFLWTIQAFRVRHRPEVRNEIWILSNLISRHLIQLK